MVVGPAPQDRVEPLNERVWGSARGCLPRVRTLVLRAWKLAVLGLICSLAGSPLRPSWLRRVCPRKSKPLAIGVMTVFSADSRTPRSAKKALRRGSPVSASTSRELAVTMKSAATARN